MFSGTPRVLYTQVHAPTSGAASAPNGQESQPNTSLNERKVDQRVYNDQRPELKISNKANMELAIAIDQIFPSPSRWLPGYSDSHWHCDGKRLNRTSASSRSRDLRAL
jgi:hypothetical protein